MAAGPTAFTGIPELRGCGCGGQGSASGIRLLVALTTPPIACEPQRSVAGPRITSTCSAASGSIGTAWSSLSSDTPLAPMPFSWTRTR